MSLCAAADHSRSALKPRLCRRPVVEYIFLPVLLECSEEENVRRMQKDERDPARIRRALEASRSAFADTDYPRIDVTCYTVDETAEALMKLLAQ